MAYKGVKLKAYLKGLEEEIIPSLLYDVAKI
jgi:hypothetical protein